MILFEAQGKEYSYPESLEDITAEKLMGYLANIEPKSPISIIRLDESYDEEAQLRSQIIAIQKRERIRPVDRVKIKELSEQLAECREKRTKIVAAIDDIEYSHQLLPYYAKVVSYFTGMPYDLIMGVEGNHMNVQELEKLFWIISSALKVNQVEDLTEVQFEGECYVMPPRLMEGSTVIEFMESAQFQDQAAQLKNGHWEGLLNITSVLLRKPGERYSDEVFERNKSNFKRLPASVLVQVGFFLLKQSRKLRADSQIFTLAQNLAKLKRESRSFTKHTVGT